MLRCTSTLSITTWKNSGDTSAKSWRKNEATSTSLSRRRYLWIAPRNQVMSNRRERSVRAARFVISTSRPSHTASSSARVIIAGRWRIRRLDDDLVVTGLAEQQKAPVAQDGYSGQWRTGKPLPCGLQATGFEVESLRAAEHLADTDRCSAELMTDLRRINPDPLKTQEHDQGGKTRVK